jgi:chemotaxis protein methyltransferase CheR
LSELTRAELLGIVALLEQHHGVGLRGDELPGWLEQRLGAAVLALCAALRLEPSLLPARLEAEPALMQELASALRVGETRFYRDGAQWEALRRHVLPGALARRTPAQPLVALSAGCSTGEEAWTLAMLLREAGAVGGARVLGVDSSEPALATARQGTYDATSAERLPPELSRRFLARAVDGSVRVVPELHKLVTFQRRDLSRGAPPGRFALIVCKNVLIYFGDHAQEQLARSLLRALTDDGMLLVARSEVPLLRSLGAQAHELAPGVTAFRGG